MAELSNFEKYVAAMAEPWQAIEDTARALIRMLDVDQAVGVWLDRIGRRVGEPRNGLADVIFRRRIRARITVNRSKGILRDLYRICRLVVNDAAAHFHGVNQGTAAYVMRVEGIALDNAVRDVLADMLRDATSGGVRMILESLNQDPATWFVWDSPGHGWDNGRFVDAKE